MSGDIPIEITFISSSIHAEAEKPEASLEDLNAMKLMIRKVRQDPLSLLKSFHLPSDLLVRQSQLLRRQKSFNVHNAQTFEPLPCTTDGKTEDLNAMKSMIQNAKRDPSSLLKSFALPNDLLMNQLKHLCPKDELPTNKRKSVASKAA